eukprot:45613-Hanusia_phi.AAC.1
MDDLSASPRRFLAIPYSSRSFSSPGQGFILACSEVHCSTVAVRRYHVLPILLARIGCCHGSSALGMVLA